jgi:hypothetical protein
LSAASFFIDSNAQLVLAAAKDRAGFAYFHSPGKSEGWREAAGLLFLGWPFGFSRPTPGDF